MPAQVFGNRWEVVRQLGEGGQSHVFEVLDRSNPETENRVLKRLKNLKRLGRFQLELEAVQSVEHPNVIAILDHDLEAAKPYLVMERLHGGSLAEDIGRWHGEPLQRLELFRQICAGVAAAHKKRVIHRDLKPENILLRSPADPPVVADFGVCYVENGARQTVSEEAVGPRLYMAPELEDGRLEDIEPSSDIYSLGKVLYALLSGGTIFSREKHRDTDRDLSRLLDMASIEHVNRLLDRMIVAEPTARYQTCDKLLVELRKVIRLIRHDYRALGSGRTLLCTFCGEGEYRNAVRPGNLTAVRNFGFTPVGNPDWRILTCRSCGHVELFRVENAERKDWWGES